MKQLFIPISLDMLPEYLSSGFIGLSSGLDPAGDIQSLNFPNILGSDSIDKITYEVCLEVEIEEGKFNLSSIKDFSLYIADSLVSIAHIKRIYFSDESEQDNFVASYGVLPDIPVNLFDLIYAKPNADLLEINNELLKSLKKKRKKKFTAKPIQLVSLMIGIKESVSWLNQEKDFIIDLTIKKPVNRKICTSVVNGILQEVGYLSYAPKHSFVLLECYFDAVDALIDSGRISSPALINKMLLGAKAGVDASESPEDTLSVVRILEKTQNIMMGMGTRPDLNDDNKLGLQRAIYLACVTPDLESFDIVRQNLSVGTVIESLAKLLVMYRLKLSYIPESAWRSSRDSLNAILFSVEHVIDDGLFNLNISKEPILEDFEIKQVTNINGISVDCRNIPLPPELCIIKDTLRALKYTPSLLDASTVEIQVHVSENNIVPVRLEMKVCQTGAHLHNVKISTYVPDAAILLNKKASRELLMSKMQEYMVALALVTNSKSLEISRYQLVGTMDREELQQHISLVAGAHVDATEM